MNQCIKQRPPSGNSHAPWWCLTHNEPIGVVAERCAKGWEESQIPKRWYHCPDCKIERTDVEEFPQAGGIFGGIVFDAHIDLGYLDECPNCGSGATPIQQESNV